MKNGQMRRLYDLEHCCSKKVGSVPHPSNRRKSEGSGLQDWLFIQRRYLRALENFFLECLDRLSKPFVIRPFTIHSTSQSLPRDVCQ